MGANIRSLNEGTDSLRKIASDITNTATDFHREFGALYGVIEGDLPPIWDGTGSKEFQSVASGAKPKFEQLFDLMNEYSSQLIKAADVYDSQAEDVKSATNNITFE